MYLLWGNRMGQLVCTSWLRQMAEATMVQGRYSGSCSLQVNGVTSPAGLCSAGPLLTCVHVFVLCYCPTRCAREVGVTAQNGQMHQQHYQLMARLNK